MSYNTRSKSKKNTSSIEKIFNTNLEQLGGAFSESDLHDFNEEINSNDSDDLVETSVIGDELSSDETSESLNVTVRDIREGTDENLVTKMTGNNAENGSQNRVIPALDKEFALRFIPEFNGDREKLQKFIKCCERMHNENYSASDSELLLSIIESKVSSAADNVVRYADYSNWPELKKVLLENFLETRTLAQIQTDLINCKQGHHENVRTFANRIEQLLADLNYVCIASEGNSATTVINSLNSKTALKAFTEGLHPPLKLIIKASRFTKLHEAIEAAVEEEKSSPQYSKNPNLRPGTRPKCSYCQKLGHTVASCYLKPGTSYARNFLPRKPDIKREPFHSNNCVRIVKCTYCKNVGHHISECRKRAYNQQNKLRNQNQNLEENRNTSAPGNGTRPGVSGGTTRAANLRQTN